MQAYYYVNKAKDKEAHGYLSLYHLKRKIAKAILECVDLWNKQQLHPTFKIKIEVKAVFIKNHENVQNSDTDCSPTESFKKNNHLRTTFIDGLGGTRVHSSPLLSGSAWMRTIIETVSTFCTIY